MLVLGRAVLSRPLCSSVLVADAGRSSRAMANEAVPKMAAVIQLCCTDDKQANFERASALVREARRRGAALAMLPEACDYIGNSAKQTLELAEPLEGPTLKSYRELARSENVALSLGGLHVLAEDGRRVRNTHVLLGADGEVLATYCKTHLFNIDMSSSGGPRLQESDYVEPGTSITNPVSTPVGQVGLGICYDLRFAEFSSTLAARGAEILTYPSAFTVATGMAHWEVLLRGRAVETQCYVAAAAQTGRHNDKRASFGHSMIVDPWGTVLARCGEGEGLALAEIKPDYIQSVRRSMPVSQHRRKDLYGLVADGETVDVDDAASYDFGGHTIRGTSLVLATRYSLVSVNKKPVLPGHLLVLPRRSGCPRLKDLTAEETADLFLTARRAARVAEAFRGGKSSTVAVQDGADAGQTVQHVHVHVLARAPGDFGGRNDEVYERLDQHDKGNDHQSKWRTEEEMALEASQLRSILREQNL
jgi:predicted amidohydrolase/diadenosine tetraphosphate (Ap4A) HIT family hydrolase